jgi:hypothetical protein
MVHGTGMWLGFCIYHDKIVMIMNIGFGYGKRWRGERKYGKGYCILYVVVWR